MKKINKFIRNNLHWLIVLFVALLCTVFIVAGDAGDDGFITLGGKVTVSQATEQFIENAKKATIEYAKENVPTIIINENGEEQVIDTPTIDFIDGEEIPADAKLLEDGQGAYHDTTTYLTYYNSVGIGACINNAFGAQCFALADDFWQNYAGRALSSCGTGAAKGTLNCYDYNAGDEFEMIWDATQIQPGDWIVTKGGTWGHIFMAMGYYNNGYVAGFGQNQGGGYCAGGGAATNVVNLNLSTFGGAFRPKTYVKPSPTPIPTPTPTPHKPGDVLNYTYVYGDYFSKVLTNLGIDEGHLWGETGTVVYYTGQLIDQDMLDTKGNVKVGIPFKLTVR